MKRIDIRYRKIFSLALFFAISLAAVTGCTKEENFVKEEASITLLKATVSGEYETKTLHQFADNKLKVKWASGDQIRLFVGTNSYKLVQTGAITDNGHTALFAPEASQTIALSGQTATAVYPFISNLSYNIQSQKGTLESLPSTDILLASATITESAIEELSFSPLCAILRLPKESLITDENYTGNLNLTFTGTNVGGVVELSQSGDITITPSNIEISTRVTKGKLNSDLYVTFAPISKQGKFTYSLKSDKKEQYNFDIENINTQKIYIVQELSQKGVVIFEDENFKKYCVDNFDKDGDGEISYQEAEEVKSIYINNIDQLSIRSLGGIEHFKNLESLTCKGSGLSRRGNLESLDLSKNTELIVLQCSYNQLTSLNVSSLSKLAHLDCAVNNLSSLDVTKNTALGTLYCAANQLTSLNVSKNPALIALVFKQNKIGSINLGANTALTHLYCEDNNLKALNLSNNSLLTVLYCSNNQLTSLDVSKNPALRTIDVTSNQIAKINFGAISVTGSNSTFATEALYCSGNKLTALDLSNLPKLNLLLCSSNQLTSLDVSKNSALGWLECYRNELAELDLRKNSNMTLVAWPQNGSLAIVRLALIRLAIAEKQSPTITFMALNINTNELEDVSSPQNEWGTKLLYGDDTVLFEDENFKKYCVDNFDKDGDGEISYQEAEEVKSIYINNIDQLSIRSLGGIEHFKNLESLTCKGSGLSRRGNLESLDLSKNTELIVLQCSYNQLTSLNVSSLSKLAHLDCAVNNLSSLDVTKNTALGTLYCAANQLTSLNVSKNPALIALVFKQNKIGSINLGANTALTHLYCEDNNLKALNLSNNSLLTVLYCSNNQLTSLDVSKNPALRTIDVTSNQIAKINFGAISVTGSNSTFATEALYCSGNKLTALDLSNLPKLNLLLCSSNQLTSLDVSKNSALGWLECYGNSFSELDLRKNSNMTLVAWPQNGTLGAIRLAVSEQKVPTITFKALNANTNELVDVLYPHNEWGTALLYEN